MSDFRSEGERTFDLALQTKKFRASMYREAKKALDEGIAPKIRDIHISQVSGYTIEGDLPNCVLSVTPEGRDSRVFPSEGVI